MSRRLSIASLAGGLIVIGIARAIAPIAGPPLYDGVVPMDPYRWLDPPPAGQQGGAAGASASFTVNGTESAYVIMATSEDPPQAQILALPGTLMMPPGTTLLQVSITPIRLAEAPASGHIAGNVYRILVTDQAGRDATAPAAGMVTVVLRGPDGLVDATLEEYSGGTWHPLETSPAGFASTFLATVTTFGSFALVEPGPGPTPAATASPTVGSSGVPGSEPPTRSPTATPEAPTATPGAPTATPGAPTGSLGATPEAPTATPEAPTATPEAPTGSLGASLPTGEPPAAVSPTRPDSSGGAPVALLATIAVALVVVGAIVVMRLRATGAARNGRASRR